MPMKWVKSDKDVSAITGMAFMTASTFVLATLDASAKMAVSEVNVIQLLWGRMLTQSALLGLVVVWPQREVVTLKTNRPLSHFVRAFLLVASTTLFWFGLINIPLAAAVTIGNLTPLLVVIIAHYVLRERIDALIVLCVISGFVGVAIVAHPREGFASASTAYPLAMAVCYATFQVITRSLTRTDSNVAILFYTSSGALIITSAPVPFIWVPLSGRSVLSILWLGVLGTIAHLLLIRAFSYTEASSLAPFNYLGIGWSELLGIIMFSEIPDSATIIGAVVVIGSNLLVWMRRYVGRNNS
jgi:drug/metabolite transporter (DMT)-like permease